MTKAQFLTVRWNNWLSLALGIPTLIYIVVAFSTSIWPTRGGIDRAGGSWGALLNSHRTTYSHAVRLASKKHRKHHFN